MTIEKISVIKTNKLLGLEALRFFCAFSVLLWHYQHFFYLSDKKINFTKELQPLYSTFSFLYDYGFYAVQIFWCISGFIFFWHYKDPLANKIIKGKRFFVLRFSRLYPLHFVTLLLVTFLQFLYFSQKKLYFVYQYNDFKHFVLQLFLASNWGFQKGDSFNGPIWSISIEILIYFIFFITLRYIGGSVIVNIAVIAIFLYIKVNHTLIATFDLILNCIGFFYIGGLTAITYKFIEKTNYKQEIRLLSTIIAILVPLLIYFFKQYEIKNLAFKLLVFYVPILVYCCAQKINPNVHIQKTIEILGNMTYSSYLIHFPIQITIVLVCALFNIAIPLYSLTFFLCFIFTTLTSSYLIYLHFELPAQEFIRNKFISL